MSSHDINGAAEPEAVETPVSRRQAILGGLGLSSRAVAGLALGSAPVALAALAGDVFGQERRLPGDVVDVLNFGLLLEELGVDFYTRALAADGLLTGPLRAIFGQILKHEEGHRRFLRATLGSRAIAPPRFDFTGAMGRGNGPLADVFSNLQTFLAVSQGLEDLGVRALKGQAPYLLRHDAVLQPALRIHSVEARHASQVRRLRGNKGWIVGESPDTVPPPLAEAYEDEDNTFHFILAPLRQRPETTRAFDEPMTRAAVLRTLRPFLASEIPPVGERGEE